jgi:tryptophan synthase alpha subunit
MVMTADTATLLNAFEDCQMVEIDGLHTFDFSLDDQKLLIICMDGRDKKHWRFSLEQVKAATFDQTLQSWTLTGDSGEHRLVCMSGVTGNNNDEDEADDDA